MSLRNFQLIDSGQQAPSVDAFFSIFKKLPRHEYKDAIQSYFETMTPTGEFNPVVDYIEKHLTPAFELSEKSIWDSNRPSMTYSEEQLNFLEQNLEAMKLHHRLTLREFVPKSDLIGKEEVVKKLVKLELAQNKKDGLYPCRTLFRAPTYENSAPSSVRKATRYLLKHFDAYVSEEGSPKQELGYALQLVTPQIAGHILAETVKFKRWIQSVASQETEGDLIPLVVLSFAKQLESKEL